MRFLLLTTLIITGHAYLFSQNDPDRLLFVSNSGLVTFTSDAPLEIINATSTSLRGLLDPDQMTFAFQMETRTFKGFNSPLQQEHFYENYIESDKFPQASFHGKIVERIDFNAKGTVEVRAKGILEIHGVSRERIIQVTIMKKESSLSISSSFSVSLDEHNIEVPKLVNQKIAENIEVEVNIDMVKSSSP